MANLVGDIRYAFRQFWVARVFTATAVLTLALGIGGTTATIARATGSFVRSAASRRQSRRLVGIVALVLAAVGLYGVTAYKVAQRTNEIGLRMALGADRRRVIEMVMQGAFWRVAIGLALGLPLAVGAGRLLSTQLYGVSFWDPLALGFATLSLATCACIAAIIPATRASSISPMKALRAE